MNCLMHYNHTACLAREENVEKQLFSTLFTRCNLFLIPLIKLVLILEVITGAPVTHFRGSTKSQLPSTVDCVLFSTQVVQYRMSQKQTNHCLAYSGYVITIHIDDRLCLMQMEQIFT